VTGVTISQTAPAARTFGIKVSGNKLVSTVDGSTVELIGTSASGLDNGQSQSYWMPYANSTPAFWQSVAAYRPPGGGNINVVRLGLNSAFWVGYACGFSASTYQSTVEHVVSVATRTGLYVILDLHWDATGSTCPTGQSNLPSTNALTFWTSVANTFKGNPAVMFELFNEPYGARNTSRNGGDGTEWVLVSGSYPSGTFRVGSDGPYLVNGGTYNPFIMCTSGPCSGFTNGSSFTVEGEKQLITAIRSTGATNVILASSLGWAADIFTWLSAYNTAGNPDPLKQLAASWHVYGYALGTSGPLAVLAAGYPIVITETYGFDANLDGGAATTAGYTWAQSNNIGYLCYGVINDWSGQTTLSLTSTPPWAGCVRPNRH
jgi:endoglucanase